MPLTAATKHIFLRPVAVDALRSLHGDYIAPRAQHNGTASQRYQRRGGIRRARKPMRESIMGTTEMERTVNSANEIKYINLSAHVPFGVRNIFRKPVGGGAFNHCVNIEFVYGHRIYQCSHRKFILKTFPNIRVIMRYHYCHHICSLAHHSALGCVCFYISLFPSPFSDSSPHSCGCRPLLRPRRTERRSHCLDCV